MTDQPPKGARIVFKIIAGIIILIIAMGLLFPASSGGGGYSRKGQAKNDMVQIVNAVKSFNAEYGKYPVDPSKMGRAKAVVFGDPSLSGYLGDNSAVIDVLRNNTASPANGALVAKLNPRGIVFIDGPVVKSDSVPKGGIRSMSGVWYDPWGTPYNLAFSTAYDDQIPAAIHGYTDANPRISALYGDVIAWSYGKDRMAGTMGNHSCANSDDVISWQ